MNQKLKKLQDAFAAKREAFQAAATAIQEAADDTSPDDLAALTATLDTTEAEFKAADDALELFNRTEKAKAIALPEFDSDDEDKAAAKVGKEPLTYDRFNGKSIFHDLYASRIHADSSAAERLSRHATEMRVEGRDKTAKYDLSSTDSAGGYLVAPIYLQDEFISLARAGRVTANLIGSRPLPPNTDSVNIPTMATGVSTAAQADNGAVSETDATFGTVAADVKTVAGMQDVSQQLVDRSVPGIDEVIFADLVASYNVNLDTAVINSATANNLGLLQVSGINAVTYTDASPTLPEAYPKVADAIQQIATGIFMSAEAIVVHPRRWAWMLAAQDTVGRPLVTPYAPANSAAAHGGVVAEGPVGDLQGLPVYVDPNIPINLGGGTNEDRVIVLRKSDCYLWEDQSGPYLDTFRDVLSGALGVRFRLFNYYAQCHARRPKAISVISGTGLITPTF